MKVTYLKDEKDEADIELDNTTITELLRAYLSKDDSVTFVAWRREHPSKNPILKVKTKGKSVRKAVEDAIKQIDKEADKILDEVKSK